MRELNVKNPSTVISYQSWLQPIWQMWGEKTFDRGSMKITNKSFPQELVPISLSAAVFFIAVSFS